MITAALMVGFIVSDVSAQSATLLLRTEGEMESMTRRINALGVLSEEQSKRLAFLLREHRDAISLFANHGLLSNDELQVKISEIVNLADLQIRLLLSPSQMAVFQSVTKRPIRRRIIVPVAAE